jgi:predicted phage-related endonuclease
LVYPFLVSEHFPDFDRMIDEATEWWENHILTGVSPPYDERADAEYLKALRTERLSTLNFKKGIKDIIAQAETLEKKLLEVKESVKEDAAKLKELDAEIKAHMEKQLSGGSNRVTVDGDSFRFELLKSTRSTVDIEKLKEDGLFEDYATTTETLRLTKKRLEGA